MRIIITRSYLFWPLNHNFSKSLKLNCQCSYKYVQSFWNWPSVFWIYREYLCGFWCWKCKYYNLYQNNLGCNHHQSCNEDSLKIMEGPCKRSIIEGEGHLMVPCFWTSSRGKQQAILHGVVQLLNLGWATWSWIQALFSGWLIHVLDLHVIDPSQSPSHKSSKNLYSNSDRQPEYFEKICKILKAHLTPMCNWTRSQAS